MPKAEHQDSTVLTDDELRTLDAHGRAANYLAVARSTFWATRSWPSP